MADLLKNINDNKFLITIFVAVIATGIMVKTHETRIQELRVDFKELALEFRACENKLTKLENDTSWTKEGINRTETILRRIEDKLNQP